MGDTVQRSRRDEARYAQPIVGTVDALGYLEVAGPIPATEMGLRSRRRVRLVGTMYEPETVGDACARRSVTPRFLVRSSARTPQGTTGKPTKRTAYQAQTTVRVARKGEVTRACYRFHEPELAGRTVAVVSDVVHRRRGVWAALPVLVALLAITLAKLGNRWYDPNARHGHYDGKTPEEIRRDLDTEVDWWSMEISVASSMSLHEGETELEARIENIEANHCDQIVKLYPTDNPSDLLFQSGALAPGEYLQTIELAHPLPVGNNDLTVEFQGYEQGVSLLSNEGVLLGHDMFGASCAAEVNVYCAPREAST